MINVTCVVSEANISLIALPETYKWESNSVELLQSSLASPLFQNKIKEFNGNIFHGNTDTMVSDLNSITLEAADTCIKNKRVLAKSHKTKKYFKRKKNKVGGHEFN